MEEYRLLVEKVDQLSTTLCYLQEFIDIKFDLDFKEFLRKKDVSRREEYDGRQQLRQTQACRSDLPPTNRIQDYMDDENEQEIKIEVVQHDDEYAAVDHFPFPTVQMDEQDREHLSSEILEPRHPPGAEQKEEEYYVNKESSPTLLSRKPHNLFFQIKGKSAKTKTKKPVSTLVQKRKPVIGDPLRHQHFGITYKLSRKGNEQLVYDSYQFVLLNRRPSGKVYWACRSATTFKCRAIISQKEDGSPTVSKCGHSHPPPDPNSY